MNIIHNRRSNTNETNTRMAAWDWRGKGDVSARFFGFSFAGLKRYGMPTHK